MARRSVGSKPKAPQNLSGTRQSSTSAVLTWVDLSTNETGFEVQRRITGGSVFSLVATVAAGVATYLDATLSAGVSYDFRVRAKKDTVYSPVSNQITLGDNTSTTPITTPPSGSPGEGGFVELSTSVQTRTRLTASEITAFVPATRGQFTFPAPYLTKAWRLTQPSDGTIFHAGYSYWANLNNSTGSDTLYAFVGLATGGSTLFRIVKSTGAVTNLGSIFNIGSQGRAMSGEAFFFSPTFPTRLYWFPYGSVMKRVDVLTHVETDVFDIASAGGIAAFGASRNIAQVQVSANDDVFSFIVRNSSDVPIGSGTYKVSTNSWKFYPTLGFTYDECSIDRSGEYLLVEESQVLSGQIIDRVFRLSDDREVRRTTGDAAGHSDMGYRQVINVNQILAFPAITSMDLTASPLVTGPVVYRDASWSFYSTDGHLSFLHATDTALGGQFMVVSTARRDVGPRGQEIFAVKLDGSLVTLIIAPSMTLREVGEPYETFAFANVDRTGRYVLWTSNVGVEGGPLVAFVVQIPRGVTGWDV